jgi:6-phosphogluconolactonase (cycloisomerase 2 family)
MHRPDGPRSGARLAAITTLAVLALGACNDATSPASPTEARASRALGEGTTAIGGVFVTTNGADGNAVVAFARGADGTLTPTGTFATGGSGTGGSTDPLTSLSALTLNRDNSRLYVVNAGSNSISTFSVSGGALTLSGTVPSGGTEPVSLTVSRGRLFVLNAGSNAIAEFKLGADGSPASTPLATAALATPASGASTVAASPDGRFVLVTERAANAIDVFAVAPNGALSTPVTTHSSGSTPFGFGFTPRGQAIISEAAGAAPDGAASSYSLGRDGSLSLITASVSTHQRATCWLVVTPSGRFAYAANAGSGSISGYAVAADGSLSLLDSDGRTVVTGDGSAPLDLHLSRNGKFLYVLKAGAGSIGAFAVAADGNLEALPDTPGLAPGSSSQGLAAY